MPPSVGEFRFRVSGNARICRDHYRLTLQTDFFPEAHPGQFLHLGPARATGSSDATNATVGSQAAMPFLRRAFSIAGLERINNATSADVIYRVVGAGTRWMASLVEGNIVSAIGPLGHRLPPPPQGNHAWLIAGGVGIPPLLWFARTLRESHRQVVLFVGATTAEFVPLEAEFLNDPDRAAELASQPIQIATDDGTLGFHGNVVQALRAYAAGHPIMPDGVTLYTCGPERMMHAVAEFSHEQLHPCFVCLERAMACGIGTCQSCVVPIRQSPADSGWTYKLCCTDGPVFAAEDVVWHP